MPKYAKAIAAEMEAVWKAAEAENRDLTPAERSHMEELVEAARSQHRIEEQIKQLDPRSVSFVTEPNGPRRATGGPGDVFVQSKGWQQVADPGARGQRWSTGLVEVGPSFQTKAGTLLESGQGAGWVSTPQVVPGVVDKLFE